VGQDSSFGKKTPRFIVYRSQVRALLPAGCFSGMAFSKPLQIASVASEYHGKNNGGPN